MPKNAPALDPASETVVGQVPLFQNQLRRHIAGEAGAEYANREYEAPPVSRVVPLSENQQEATKRANILTSRQTSDFGMKERANKAYELKQVAQPYTRHEHLLGRGAASAMKYMDPLDERIAEHANPHEENVIKTMRARNEQQLRNKILPQLRSQYAGYGNRSGSEDKALAKALLDMEMHSSGQEAELRHKGHEFASNRAEQEAARRQEGFYKNIGMHHNIEATNDEKKLKTFQMIKDFENRDFQNDTSAIQLQNLMGSLETMHSQEERNAVLRDWAEKNNFDVEQLQKYIELISGMPQGTSITTRYSAPVPSNYNQNAAAASLLGQIGSAQAMGGKPFAKGGSVTSTVAPRVPVSMYSVDPHAPEPNPFLERMEEMAHKVEHKPETPYVPQMMMHAFGNMMNEEDPRMGFVKGAKIGMDKWMEKKEKSAENEMQALNLRAKIFDTLREERRHDREQTRLEKESSIKAGREGRDREFEEKKLLLEEKKIDLLSGRIVATREGKEKAAEEKIKSKEEERTHRHHEKDYFERRKEHKKAVDKRSWYSVGHGDEDAKEEFIQRQYEEKRMPPVEAERMWEAQKAQKAKKTTPSVKKIDEELSLIDAELGRAA